ncbi:phosphoglucosamine mutase [Candidatus Berkiella aquae]|uniref:Phosphoglucosamine mutase n=1 Tax=Candidatus Berkiella aquae TaxID=295108 RepID=A0A0Q9YYQ1_9GAMM|nr:phosphoglucosamine mutase [Candidatus Berkiella aquae]MCS5710484.1 phosphoglucosamine mutase [Candidatus Berkiella aquae]
MSEQRKYFGTDGIRGRTGVPPITAEFALKLGWAVGQVLAQDGKGTVLIGKDTRISGYMLAAALEAGLIASGLDVYLLGPMPTPGIAYLTRSLGAQVGVVVSASHNPYYDNGIKFFSAEGKKLPDSIESKIESFLEKEMTTVSAQQIGRAKIRSDAAARYIEFCKSTFLKKYDLKGIKLVLDCANGATYHIAPHIFTELGAKVITINHQPDGFNINEECGSTAPESLQKAVIENKAELGIAFDGDGDRVIFVDHKGEVVDGDELLYIIARGYAVRGELNGGVVGTQMSNLGLENALAELSIPFIRTKVGDRYVMDALMQQGWCLGGEGSGHIICLNKTTTGDGIISALQVLGQICQSEQSLHELKKGMVKCAQVLLNVPVQSGQQVVQNERVQEACNKAQKALASEGRILLRPSGTEPLVRVMVEGEDRERIERVAQEIAAIVSEVAKETT